MSKILVIEDEAAIRRVLIKIISEESDSYDVEEAENGLDGIEKIKGEFVFHKHDDEDELFLVMKGQLELVLEDRAT